MGKASEKLYLLLGDGAHLDLAAAVAGVEERVVQIS